MHPSKTTALASTVPLTLIAVVVALSILGWAMKPIMRAFILNPYRVKKNVEVYRLLTAGFLHADVSHLAFNMFSLYIFAETALKGLGAGRFVLLYVSAIVVAFIPTTLRYMGNPKYNSLGASGAVAAVMFSAVLLDPRMQLYVMFIPIPVPGVIYAVGYLAYSAWHSYRSGDNINHDAHFSGALYGALLTYAFEPTRVEHTLRTLF